MSSALSTGLSGLLAYQRAINVHSQNIANVNTEGYVRQRVELAAQRNPSSLIGSAGVSIAQVRRDVNNYLLEQGRTSQSAAARSDVMASKAEKLVGLIASVDYGLDETLRALRNSFEALATEPTSTIIREEVFARLQSTIDRLKAMDSRIDEYETEVDARLTEEVARVNSLTRRIADLNKEIVRQGLGGAVPAPNLLDSRDQATNELANKLGIRVNQRADGSTAITSAGGILLVNGADALTLTRQPDVYQAERGLITIDAGTHFSEVTRSLTGGVVGGLLDARSQLLDGTRNELGRLAASLVVTLNERHGEGHDLAGNDGADLFTIGSPISRAASDNTGAASLSASIIQSASLTASDYRLTRTVSGWDIHRLSDDTWISPSGSGSSADPWIFDGLSVVIVDAADAVTGDRFLLRPTGGLIEEMSVSISSGAALAAAASGTPSGNNDNARRLAAGFDDKLLDGNSRSITETALRLTTRMASARDASVLSRDVQQQAADEAKSEFSDRYGVNLDEEAAELLRYQQAYQASAQVIRIANELFDSLLDAAR